MICSTSSNSRAAVTTQMIRIETRLPSTGRVDQLQYGHPLAASTMITSLAHCGGGWLCLWLGCCNDADRMVCLDKCTHVSKTKRLCAQTADGDELWQLRVRSVQKAKKGAMSPILRIALGTYPLWWILLNSLLVLEGTSHQRLALTEST